jgi:hypothetical protein
MENVALKLAGPRYQLEHLDRTLKFALRKQLHLSYITSARVPNA